jgi:transposase
MSSAYRVNRKASDADIVRLNSVGLSLATVAKALGCHPTTVTLRLKQLGVDPSDTRHTFMEDVFLRLNPDQQVWMADELERQNITIKTFVYRLLVQEHKQGIKTP